MLGFLAIAGALLVQAPVAQAQEPAPGPRVGDVSEIQWESVSAETRGGESSGSSQSRNMLVERVIAVRDGGVELEFDLPAGTSAADRGRTWQFPVRVLRPPRGPLVLLNDRELETRVNRWLDGAGLTRAACGRWYFTWDAFRIECDPQSVIQMLAAFDLGPDGLRDGDPYRQAGALGAGILRREARGVGGAVFIVDLTVDPEAVRRERAQADVVVAEITRRESLTLDAALRARANERITGTIRITFETDEAGRVLRRTKVTAWSSEAPGGERETQTVTETAERRLGLEPSS
jgi:hypothetical protein